MQYFFYFKSFIGIQDNVIRKKNLKELTGISALVFDDIKLVISVLLPKPEER